MSCLANYKEQKDYFFENSLFLLLTYNFSFYILYTLNVLVTKIYKRRCIPNEKNYNDWSGCCGSCWWFVI